MFNGKLLNYLKLPESISISWWMIYSKVIYLFNTPFLFMDLLMSRCKPSDFGVPYVPRQEPSWSQSGTAPCATESQLEASGTWSSDVFCSCSCLFMSFHVFFICFFVCLAFLWLASKLSCYEFQTAWRVHENLQVSKRSNCHPTGRHTWTKKVQVRAKPWSTKASSHQGWPWRPWRNGFRVKTSLLKCEKKKTDPTNLNQLNVCGLFLHKFTSLHNVL